MAKRSSKKKKIEYRSKFEGRVAEQLSKHKIDFKYESQKIEYIVPESTHRYVPDFELPNGILIECKGMLDHESRKKMILVKQQHPDKDIRLLFMRDQPIRKGSETKYSDWAIKNGYEFAIKEIPEEWYKH